MTVLAGIALAGIALAGCATAPEPEGEPHWSELEMTSDEILNQVLLFYLGEAWQGMSDINECLETVSRVDPEDPDSWAREWRKTAERLEATADERLAAGHRYSAGEYYMRAATYYRAALHRHMYPGSDEVRKLTEREVITFVRSQELLEAPMEVVNVPYEDTELTGYFFLSQKTDGPAPTIMIHQGRDAWAEDCRYFALEANRRGYHALLIDGPGNGRALRLQDLPFRPDWEAFVTPVVDYLVDRPEVDPDNVMLMGLSMGGYLAARAASYEPRLRILIANPGVLDWGEVFMEQLEGYAPFLLDMYENTPRMLNSVLGITARLSPFLMWGLTDTMWKHGVETPRELLDDMARYSNKDGASNITATTLVIDAEIEPYGQAQELYDVITAEKDYMLFTEEEAAPLHVQVGSLAVSSARIFDWIDEELEGR